MSAKVINFTIYNNIIVKQFKIDNHSSTKLRLFGISSIEKSYKLCWELNHHYQFQFISTKPHQIITKTNQQFEFGLYEDSQFLEQGNCYILENKTNNQLLSKQYQIADYFFLTNQQLPDEQFEDIVDKVKQLPIVQAVIPISENELSEKHKFIIYE